jgi:hypothetical protein
MKVAGDMREYFGRCRVGNSSSCDTQMEGVLGRIVWCNEKTVLSAKNMALKMATTFLISI